MPCVQICPAYNANVPAFASAFKTMRGRFSQDGKGCKNIAGGNLLVLALGVLTSVFVKIPHAFFTPTSEFIFGNGVRVEVSIILPLFTFETRFAFVHRNLPLRINTISYHKNTNFAMPVGLY